ncbi:hypothetical protein D3C81_1910940 [compost metagenome]
MQVEHGVDQLPGFHQDFLVIALVGRIERRWRLRRAAAGHVQRLKVVAHRGNLSGFGHGLDDQPFATGGLGQSGAVDDQPAGAMFGAGEHAHVGVHHHVPVDIAQVVRRQLAQGAQRTLVLGHAGALGIAQ